MGRHRTQLLRSTHSDLLESVVAGSVMPAIPGVRRWAPRQSPPLTPGQDYTYEVHARWTDDGRTVDRTRKIHVRANALTEVDLTRP